MAAWGYIRFTCRACGDRFWARPRDGASLLCHECSGPGVATGSDVPDVTPATSAEAR